MTLIEVTRKVICADGERHASLDTTEQPRALASHIEQLLAQLDLVDLERRSPVRGRGGRYEYDVTIRSASETRRRFVCEEGCAGGALAELLDLILGGQAA